MDGSPHRRALRQPHQLDAAAETGDHRRRRPLGFPALNFLFVLLLRYSVAPPFTHLQPTHWPDTASTAPRVPSDHPEYRPHLTIARSQVNNGDPLLAGIAKRLDRKSFGGWMVEHFTVDESAGGRYRPLSTISLG